MKKVNLEKEVLNALLETSDWISGGDLASSLQTSRNTIWRQIKKLQAKGYPIESITGRGYRLDKQEDKIDPEEIKLYLNHPDRFDLHYFTTLDSTNTYLKAQARNQAPAGTVIIADAQSKGKGRLGRSFFSPYESGVYFSLLIRPEQNQRLKKESPALAAVCLSKAVDQLLQVETNIKWVNDLYLNGKKVAGILSEGEIDFESQEIKFIVIGVGINVYAPQGDFPEEIKNTAGYLLTDEKRPALRNRIVAEFLNQWEIYQKIDKQAEAVEIFRQKNFLQGKQVNIQIRDQKMKVKVIDINEHFALVVQDSNGTIMDIDHGEATLHHAKFS